MKSITIKFILTAIIIAIFSNVSNGQDINPGKWELNAEALQEEIGAVDMKRLAYLPEAKKLEMMKELSSRTFTFFKDGKFLAEWIFAGQNRQMRGKWREADGRLYIENETDTTTYLIEVSKEMNLVLVPDNSTGLLQKLFFIKSNQP
ncbi:hypothetical protein [Anditalea andensis]|uniref:Lipocalin-like domain-containing protein n=1 Tax=Anditalea andensis TaxID=1048983 RepID=A0A074KTR2_9BACT|nr:hypothetical protein [Anditalea andensis]KEO71620.1 hypothetical protein EL17_24040 [Anditalea andensis]